MIFSDTILTWCNIISDIFWQYHLRVWHQKIAWYFCDSITTHHNNQQYITTDGIYGPGQGPKKITRKLFQPESFVLLFSVLVQDREVSLCYLPRGQNYKSSLDGQSTFPVMMMMTMRACKEKGLLKRSVNDKYLWWTERPILASLNHLARKGDPWMETESECQTRVKVVMTWYQRNMAQSTNIKSSSSS